MGDKNSKERNVRKLTKVGKRSISVTIPIEMIRELGWREKQKVVVAKRGEVLIIKGWKK